MFAHHREVQQALIARFPGAAHVLGGDDLAPRRRRRRLPALRRACADRLLNAGRVTGLTLVRASNVAFVELDWTPARHDQAEDRCHRIGQQDAVTAYYLLASETIDEQMASVLQRKRAVIDAVTDGHRLADTSAPDAASRRSRASRRAGAAS